MYFLNVINYSHYLFVQGIITTDGQAWVEQRRFALKHLKDFGFGKVGLHGVIQEEVDDLIIHLSKFEHDDFRYLIFDISHKIKYLI